MKKISYHLRAYFGFTKKETNGFLVLLFLMILLAFAPVLVELLYHPESEVLINYSPKRDSLVALLEKAKITNGQSETSDASKLIIATYQLRHNLFFDASLIVRKSDSALDARDLSTTFISAGIRWNIARRVHEF